MAISEKHISKTGRLQVEAAVKLKTDPLKIWVEKGIPWLCNSAGEEIRDKNGELQLDYFPVNTTKFCLWDASQNCGYVRATLPKIAHTTRSTLNSHITLKTEIDKLCKDLVKKAKQQLVEKNKASQITALGDDIKFLKLVLERQETEITQMRLKEIRLDEKITQAERALANETAHYDRTVAMLQKQVSELTASLRKVSSLKISSSP